MNICTKCNTFKNQEEFSWKYKAKNKRSSICKKCHSVLRRLHYENNRSKYIQKAQLRTKLVGRYPQPNQIYIYEYLLCHPCVDCGENDPALLEFDHIDRTTKSFTISQAVRTSKPLNEIKDEIKKCAIRCKNCHAKRTSIQFDWYRWYDTLSPHLKNQYIPPDG